MKGAILYFSIRLTILAFAITIFYNCAVYLLPNHIARDQFSFVGELDIFIILTMMFAVIYSAFIYWECIQFTRKHWFGHRNGALVLLIINAIIAIASFLISLKV
ncbi:hypothetical protein [Pedobacter punctiformis]|uniref:Uncharacterized protein n=1 Tax=Pedobacter punctiformis TaxID=3004097 RepID=A0ABT4L894_9SPHI|nr:hypothetical protein [Pedobacter sp. HCMS5-2]MCZ4244138.1 hypothetical protein [Pedobacter sp. HCMS5-2]